MARYKNAVTGVTVSVSDEKELSSDWELEGEKPKRTTKKSEDK